VSFVFVIALIVSGLPLNAPRFVTEPWMSNVVGSPATIGPSVPGPFTDATDFVPFLSFADHFSARNAFDDSKLAHVGCCAPAGILRMPVAVNVPFLTGARRPFGPPEQPVIVPTTLTCSV